MQSAHQFYIDGQWQPARGGQVVSVLDPASETPIGEVACATAAEVDLAVQAARRAFASFSRTPVEQRALLLERIGAALRQRADEAAACVSAEMGAPLAFARSFHVLGAAQRFEEMAGLVRGYAFEQPQGSTLLVREAIGVCALIVPWNVPLVSLAGKLAAALAAGCTVVAKPSEVAPFSALVLAEALHEAGVPPGVVNLLNGDGALTGTALVEHPEVDMINFTGSTRAGVAIGKAAAESVKRVLLELGGKSPNLLLPGVDLEAVVPASVRRAYVGSGQSCQAPTRLLVHRAQAARAAEIAAATADAIVVGDPRDPTAEMGPLASAAQFDKVQALIGSGIEQGARLVAGGPGRPDGLARGLFVRPTVFADVEPWMRIAREEIFGPVLSILTYEEVEEAIEIANDTEYGLAAWVYGPESDACRRIAGRLRAGRVYLNGAGPDPAAPFGGYKRSGNGREGGVHGLESHLELKAVMGWSG